MSFSELMSGSLCLNYLYKHIAYVECLLSFWVPGIWCKPARERMPVWSASKVIQTPVGNISNVLSPLIAERIKHVLCASAGREPLLSLCLVFLDFAPYAFFLYWVSFVSFHCSKSQLWVWPYAEPAIPPSESLNLGLVSGNLTQRIAILIIHILQKRKMKCRQVKKITRFSSRLKGSKIILGDRTVLNCPIFCCFWVGYKMLFPQISLLYQYSVTMFFMFPATKKMYYWIDQGSAHYRPWGKFNAPPVLVPPACQKSFYTFNGRKIRQNKKNVLWL